MSYLTDSEVGFILTKMADAEERNTLEGYKVRVSALRKAAAKMFATPMGEQTELYARRYAYLRDGDPQATMAIFGSNTRHRLDSAIEEQIVEDINKAVYHE